MSLKAVAIHESAHLLCGFLNGARITKVVCDGWNNQTLMRHIGLLKNDINCDHPLAMQAVMIFLAGPAAEERFTGTFNLRAASGDLTFARASMVLKGWPDDDDCDDEEFYHEFSGPAKQFVAHELRWKMICEFAEHLRAKRELTGRAAVQRVLTEAKKWPFADRREFLFPRDGLGGDQLPLQEQEA